MGLSWILLPALQGFAWPAAALQMPAPEPLEGAPLDMDWSPPPGEDMLTPELQQRTWSGNCTYGEFGSTRFLQGVQVLPSRTTHLPFGKNFNPTELFVHPASKVAMCTIRKNGCYTWTTFWRKMTNSTNFRNPAILETWTNWSEENANAVFEDPGSARIAWVREPLARFLSGFLDKCARRPPGEPGKYTRFCPFHGGSDPGFPLAQVMDWFKANHTVKELDNHFRPQFMHCELSRRLQEYNLIGLMTKASFAEDAACLVERARPGWSSSWSSFFPKANIAAPMTPANAAEKARREVEILKKFFTKGFARYLMDSVFAEDYRLFRIERPAWVEHATGEWFRTRPPFLIEIQEDTMKNLAKADVGPEDDEDDIEELAAKLGYTLDF